MTDTRAQPLVPLVCFARSDAEVDAAHDLFLRRIGRRFVEDATSFRVSAGQENADWVPRLALAYAPSSAFTGKGPAGPGTADGRPVEGMPQAAGRQPESGRSNAALAGAQLGGLLPSVGLVSLPYSAVERRFEGRGVYLALKRAMLAELRAVVRARGLPAPAGNVSEEVAGSAQYRRKVEGGYAVPLPLAYVQPAAQGLAEAPLVLTFEPFVSPLPAFTPDDLLRIVAAVYRGLYRIAEPETDPAFRRIASATASGFRERVEWMRTDMTNLRGG